MLLALVVAGRSSGAGPHPNQPSGFTEVGTHSFTTKSASGWNDFSTGAWAVDTAANGPLSPPNGVKLAMTPGSVACPHGGPWEMSIGGSRRAIYVHWAYKVSSNHWWYESGHNKWPFGLHISADGGRATVYFMEVFGVGQANGETEFVTQVTPFTDAIHPNVTNVPIVRGNWHEGELLLYLGTPGNNDGVLKWWVNGTLVGNYTMNFMASNWTNPRYTLIQALACIYGHNPQPTVTSEAWLDHIYVSVKNAL